MERMKLNIFESLEIYKNEKNSKNCSGEKHVFFPLSNVRLIN